MAQGSSFDFTTTREWAGTEIERLQQVFEEAGISSPESLSHLSQEVPERRVQQRVFQTLTLQACAVDSTYLHTHACLLAINLLRDAGWCEGNLNRLLRLAVGLQPSPAFSATYAIRAFLEAGAEANAPGTLLGWSCAQQAAAQGILGVDVDLWVKAGLDPLQTTPQGHSLVHLALDPGVAHVMVPLGSGVWPAVLAVAGRWSSADWRRFNADGVLSERLSTAWNLLLNHCKGAAPEWDARPVLARAQAEWHACWLGSLPDATHGVSGRL